MGKSLAVLLALAISLLLAGSAMASSRKAPGKKEELKDRKAAASGQEAKPQAPAAKPDVKATPRGEKPAASQAGPGKKSGQFGKHAAESGGRGDGKPAMKRPAEPKGRNTQAARNRKSHRAIADGKRRKGGGKAMGKRGRAGMSGRQAGRRARGKHRGAAMERGRRGRPRDDRGWQGRASAGQWDRRQYGRGMGMRPFPMGRGRGRMMRGRWMGMPPTGGRMDRGRMGRMDRDPWMGMRCRAGARWGRQGRWGRGSMMAPEGGRKGARPGWRDRMMDGRYDGAARDERGKRNRRQSEEDRP